MSTAADHEAVHRRVRERLSELDQRYTSGRRRLVDLLLGAGRPVTLPELQAMDPAIPQSSTYRNLDVLERTGLVRRLSIGSDYARYELAEPLLGHHHHLICLGCGRVEDVTLADSVERIVDDALTTAAHGAGFAPAHHSVDLHGHCSRCSATVAR